MTFLELEYVERYFNDPGITCTGIEYQTIGQEIWHYLMSVSREDEGRRGILTFLGQNSYSHNNL